MHNLPGRSVLSGRKKPIMNLERSLHAAKLENIKYFHRGNYQRVYWGNEFCQNLIPSLGDTGKILGFCVSNGVGFSLLTPFVTEAGLRTLIKVFNYLKNDAGFGLEIVINDWGVLKVLNERFTGVFSLVLGRLLTRQYRDHGIKEVLRKSRAPCVIKCADGTIRVISYRSPGRLYSRGIKSSYINTTLAQDLLRRYKVGRVEFNNTVQGIDLEGVSLRKSVYAPYVNVSTTRFCPMETRKQKLYRINVCGRECQRHYDILKRRGDPVLIYKRGNTTFYRNVFSEPALKNLGIDRLVFQPELPF